jgi:hypothetical protein
MGKKIGIAVAVVVVLLLGVIATRPATFHIERSATVAAKPETTFAFVNNVESRHAWYPWDKLDPAMKRTYSDNKEGVGASYAWAGNDKAGEGKQAITESVVNQKVVDKLEFIKPFASTNTVTFTFTPEGDGTKVVWAMDGSLDFMGKAFSLVMDMDKAVGPDFEQGLKNLNEVASAEQKKVNDAAAAAAAAMPPPATPPPADGAAAPKDVAGPPGSKG